MYLAVCCLTHNPLQSEVLHGMCHRDDITKEILLFPQTAILINLFPQFSIKFTITRTGKAAVKITALRRKVFEKL